jgi:hypothetical protein
MYLPDRVPTLTDRRSRTFFTAVALLLATGCSGPPGDEAPLGTEATQQEVEATAKQPPPGALVLSMEDAPHSGDATPVEPGVITPQDANCGGIFNPCGIVYNRSGQTLQLSRDSASHLTCQARGPYRDLPDGKNSNSYGSPHWPDTDCVRSNNGWIITNGRWYAPGDWIRVWTSKWIY